MFAVTVLVAGCGGDDDPVGVPEGRVSPGAEAPTTTGSGDPGAVTSTTVPPLEVAEQVFAALATRDARAIEAVAGLTVPGSPAAVVVAHQARVAELLDEFAGPWRTSASTTETPGTAPDVTAPDGVGSVCATRFSCTVFSAPEFDATGALRGFAIDGVSVDGLVRSAGPEVVADGLPVRMRVTSTYRTASGRVSVLVETVNDSQVAVSPFAFAAVHRHRTVADGTNGLVEAEGAWGPTAIEPGGSAHHLVVFGAGPVDGEVVITAVTADGVDLAFVLPLLAP